MIELILKTLEEVAKNRKTIYYSQLQDELYEKSGKKVFILKLPYYLHKICQKTYKEKGFMLGAVVVSKKRKTPSEGFFRFAEKLLNKKFKSDEEKIKFWQNELKKIYREYGN